MKFPGWVIYVVVMLPVWVVASGRISAVQFAWGLFVVILTLPLAWRLFDLGRLRRLRPLLRAAAGTVRVFVVLFIPDALRSSLDMARRVVQPVVPMEPGIVAVPLRFRSSLEELLISNHIMLTPGTVLVEVDEERGYVFVHSIDASNPERVRRAVLDLERETLRRIYG